MAALSYYSNWETPLHQLNSDISTFFTPELPPQLLGYMNDEFSYSDENIFDPNDLFYFDEYCNNALPSSTSPSAQNLLTPIPTQVPVSLKQEFEPFHYPKRQKPDLDFQEVMYSDALFDELAPNPCFNFQDFSPPKIVAPQLPDFATGPPVYNDGSCEQCVKKQPMNGRTLSAQSIAARQRRRKITEKTQELGKLIPGAQRMNTAEMFQAAYKYIKYLQAQVGILEFVSSYQQEKSEEFESEELQGIVGSPMVQEKLYSSEKCLVPRKFAQQLSSDENLFQTKTHVWKEIRELLPNGER